MRGLPTIVTVAILGLGRRAAADRLRLRRLVADRDQHHHRGGTGAHHREHHIAHGRIDRYHGPRARADRPPPKPT